MRIRSLVLVVAVCFGGSLHAQRAPQDARSPARTVPEPPASTTGPSSSIGASVGYARQNGANVIAYGINVSHRFSPAIALGLTGGRSTAKVPDNFGTRTVRANTVGAFLRTYFTSREALEAFVEWSAGLSGVTQKTAGSFRPAGDVEQGIDLFSVGLSPAISYSTERVRFVSYVFSVAYAKPLNEDLRVGRAAAGKAGVTAGFTPGIGLELIL